MTIALPTNLEHRLNELAGRLGRSREDLAAEAIALYVAEQLADLDLDARIEQGLADIEAGRYRAWDEIATEMVAEGALNPNWREQLA